MKKKIITLFICWILLSACTAEKINTNIKTAIPTGANNTISLPINQQTISPKTTMTLTIPTNTVVPDTSAISPTVNNSLVIPKITQVCPGSREVSWEELGLDSEYKLIVESAINQAAGFWVISGGDTISQVIPNTYNPGWTYNFNGISPNGQWIFYEGGPENSFDTNLWISSIDGTNQWQIMQIDYRFFEGWVSNDDIYISRRIVDGVENIPIMIKNPFTGEIRSFIQNPDLGTPLFYISMDGFDYDLYYDNYYESPKGNIESQFILYNYESGEGQLVLNWLKNSDLDLQDPFNIYYRMRIFETSNGMISAIIDQTYGVDIMDEMNVMMISKSYNYQDVMAPIKLPGEGPDTQITWVSHVNSKFALDRLDYYRGEPRPSQFYIFDYRSMTLTDYCLDRGKFEPISYSSPDDRFLAWTEDDINTGKPKDSFVLDLVTGFIARINNVEVLGWGVINQQ